MNLFYEKYPREIWVENKCYSIITDFREYIRLLDMLKDDSLTEWQKLEILNGYFLDSIVINENILHAFVDFVSMNTDKESLGDREVRRKPVFSYEIDYPFILAAFMHDYGIDLETVEYLHWWKFRMLFDGLSDDTEIKQRIRYRSIDLSTIKDNDERNRIRHIQAQIMLPENEITDYDIGDAFF